MGNSDNEIGRDCHQPNDGIREAMPRSYTIILAFWLVPFVLLAFGLVVFYSSVLIVSLIALFNIITHPLPLGKLGSNIIRVISILLIGIITGAYLLRIMVKALMKTRIPQGTPLPKGTFPQLETLIHDCTLHAGIEYPDDIFIVPDANAYAYSSGRFSLHENLNHYILIGAPLLLYLEPSAMKAVLLHEFGHLIVRRKLWAVSLRHKVEDFLTLCLRAQLQRQGSLWVFMFTFLPGIIVALFLRVFQWSLNSFSRQEELLVDRIAARLMGRSEFCRELVRSITTINALRSRIGNERSLVEQINTEFHCRIMSSATIHSRIDSKANYFQVVREIHTKATLRWKDRVASAYCLLIGACRRRTDSHPTLSERIDNLHGEVVRKFHFYPTTAVHLFDLPLEAETMISVGLASDSRAIFLKAKLEAAFNL